MNNNSDNIKNKNIDFLSLALKLITYGSMIITVSVIVFLVGYILIKGIPHLTPSLFAFEFTNENQSLMPALINTLYITFLALLISAPIGIFSAIFLVEYASRGNKFVQVIRIAAETLSGIPSIVYGLFGMIFFIYTLGWGRPASLIAGTLTLSIMILPLIMRTTEEALLSVPDSFREGSFGLGAGKLRTVFAIILPSAMPGILSGIILAIGRIVGETAALIYTAGTVAEVPSTVMDSARTLAVHMYVLSNEGLHVEKSYATAVVLLIMVAFINAISGILAKKVSKG